MPFDVYPIKGTSTITDKDGARTLEDVRRDIADAYEAAADSGGRIIAGHTLAIEENLNNEGGEPGDISGKTEYLFLVATLPGKDGYEAFAGAATGREPTV